MQNKLAVVLLLIVAVYVVIVVLQPIHSQRQQYDQEVEQYTNGLTA